MVKKFQIVTAMMKIKICHLRVPQRFIIHIRSRFGDKVMLIDTGMLASYYPGGKASALEITDEGKFTAVYLDQQVVLLEGKSSQR